MIELSLTPFLIKEIDFGTLQTIIQKSYLSGRVQFLDLLLSFLQSRLASILPWSRTPSAVPIDLNRNFEFLDSSLPLIRRFRSEAFVARALSRTARSGTLRRGIATIMGDDLSSGRADRVLSLASIVLMRAETRALVDRRQGCSGEPCTDLEGPITRSIGIAPSCRSLRDFRPGVRGLVATRSCHVDNAVITPAGWSRFNENHSPLRLRQEKWSSWWKV